MSGLIAAIIVGGLVLLMIVGGMNGRVEMRRRDRVRRASYRGETIDPDQERRNARRDYLSVSGGFVLGTLGLIAQIVGSLVFFAGLALAITWLIDANPW